jgi:phosphoenolpyruvate-protein phosphotransferase
LSGRVVLHAPLAGWLCGLEEVPDEVFAGGMMGDGIAIDPLEGELVAPCNGTVAAMAPTAHAVTVRAANGAEILLHIGVDTVGLAGTGFTAHVAAGQTVRLGDRLISFDLDAVALAAKSVVTPILVTGEGFTWTASAQGRVVAGAPIGSVEGGSIEAPASGGEAVREVLVTLASGIHARPAARIAARVKEMGADVRLRSARGEANARSPVSVMALDIRSGDAVTLVGAAAAVAAVAHLIEVELPAHEPAQAVARAAPAEQDGPEIGGVCAVPGVAIGPAFQLSAQEQPVPEKGAGAEVERAALESALAQVRAGMASAVERRGATAASIAAAHLELSRDEAILAAADAGIGEGQSAAFAWRAATRRLAESLSATGNPLLAERVGDLRDVERQVVAALTGAEAFSADSVPEGAIVVAADILPSEASKLAGRVAGFCTAGGGPTSHMAIIAAASGIPTLVAAGDRVTGIADGTMLLLDASVGRLTVDPPEADLAAARSRLHASAASHAADAAAALEAGRTADGTRVHVFANVGSVAEAAAAVRAGAEGCGLLRTEFLFLGRDTAPTEEEQRLVYQGIADALEGRPLIVRTLDVGGDKPLPYLPIPPEDNPALGLRGVRTTLWRPEILDEQLRAILAVAPAGRCRIMVPMVASVSELMAVRARLEALGGTAELGVMIETPAAALLADRLAAYADFFSVGTNDLSQYALAMDRGNPMVAGEVDAFHPAVLRLIAAAAQAAERHNRPIGACGGLASIPAGAALLVGLGVHELSVAPAAIAGVKAALRRVTLERCREAAARALDLDSPREVRALFETIGTAE